MDDGQIIHPIIIIVHSKSSDLLLFLLASYAMALSTYLEWIYARLKYHTSIDEMVLPFLITATQESETPFEKILDASISFFQNK